MYHARISILFKIEEAKKNEKAKKAKRRKMRRRGGQKVVREKEEETNKQTDKTYSISDVVERDLERPGNERLVSRLRPIVQSKRNVKG